MLVTLVLAGAALAAEPRPADPQIPRNVIVFIADGAGENTHRAWMAWAGREPVYHDWQRHTVTTHALRAGIRPVPGVGPLDQDPGLVFDAALAFDTTPDDGEAGGYPYYFAGYRWLRATAPDSANTATTVFSGVSTYKGAINIDGAGEPIPTLAQHLADRGVAVGIVASVPWSHATPAAAAGATVPRRSMYHQISNQMLTSGVCTVIAGPGHPGYDDNAQPLETPNHQFISAEDWSALARGRIGEPAWTLVEDDARVRALAEGPTPERLFIAARAHSTLHQKRAPWTKGDATPPGEHPRNKGVPTLLDMSLAALNAVDDDPDGFFLVIEGGAVDWAMHDNQIGRMIEEFDDFHATVEAFVEILDAGERGFDWSDTLVLLTSDHDHLLLGPDSDTRPFQPVEDRGPGRVPGHIWHSDNHSSLPVPLLVRGVGAGAFAEIPTQTHQTPEGPVEVFHQADLGRALIGLLTERSGTD